jgi:2-polyprenyl-3-methyl-5-hydroxy-6-metoxy-1,4-benzoquinol methylase
MNCRICSGSTQLSYVLRSNRSRETVQLFYCPACDFYLSAGVPVRYDVYHENFDILGYYGDAEQSIRSRFQRVFSFVESLIPAGRFFDIGAGMGYSLDVAKNRGWLATGLEPNATLAQNAAGRGLDVQNSYLSVDTAGEYDFILIDNVLEHIPQPLDFLRLAKRHLAPTGLMLIAVPPMDWLRKALAAFSYLRNSASMPPQLNIFREVDEHVNVFSREAMGRLLKAVGLRPLGIRFHHSFAYDNVVFRTLQLDDGYYFVGRE